MVLVCYRCVRPLVGIYQQVVNIYEI